jgi:hypothetical protein
MVYGKPWCTRGDLGERIVINRKRVPIPREHLIMAHLVSGVAGLCLIGAIVGSIQVKFLACAGSLATRYRFDAMVHGPHGMVVPSCQSVVPARCIKRTYGCASVRSDEA